MEFWSNETPYGLGLKIEGDYSQEIITKNKIVTPQTFQNYQKI